LVSAPSSIPPTTDAIMNFEQLPRRKRWKNFEGTLCACLSPSPGFRQVYSGKMLALTVRSRRELEFIDGRGTRCIVTRTFHCTLGGYADRPISNDL
jgi:hypothetical protein